MGYSFAYILFIGLAEIAGAWLLLWQRTKLIGVAILLPVMINILVFDAIFLDAYGALASATIYTMLLLLILASNADRVRLAIRVLLPTKQTGKMAFQGKCRLALVTLALMGVLFALDQLLVTCFGHGKG